MLDYKIEKAFRHEGYDCVVVASSRGHRCGYVAVRKGHLLFKKGYATHIPALKKMFDSLMNLPAGKAVESRGAIPLFCMMLGKRKKYTPDVCFEVHGGITYAGKAYWTKDDQWWFGFDCNHAGDSPDESMMDKRSLEIHGKYFEVLKKFGVVRTNQYVIDNCKKLAKQFKEVEK